MNLSRFVEQAVFVFGSNRQGIHGAGAARFAASYRGALAGQGEGLQGRSYALPTKARPFDTCADFALLQDSVDRFLVFADEHPWLTFMVTRVGCGLAGFRDEQVAPLFTQAPANCHLPGIWRDRRFSAPQSMDGLVCDGLAGDLGRRITRHPKHDPYGQRKSPGGSGGAGRVTRMAFEIRQAALGLGYGQIVYPVPFMAASGVNGQ